MRVLPSPRRTAGPPLALLLTLLPAAGAAQEVPDSIPPAPIDTLEVRDTLRPPPGDPRLTWLGDTLAVPDTLFPQFSEPPEVWPDSLVDPYVPPRPGSAPAWELIGDRLLSRGAYSLLDVLESEALVLGDDLGGGGLPAFLGSPVGTWTNVQVVIDGVPVGNPFAGAWDLRHLPLEAIARVAFYPGAGVAEWGGIGTGGVLAITTRRSLAPTARSALSFHLGSFDAQAFSGWFGRPVTQRGSLFLAANFDDTEGFTRQEDFTRNQLAMKLGWRLGKRHLVEIARLSDGLSGEANRATVRGDQDQDVRFVHAFYHGDYGPLDARLHWFHEEHRIDTNFEFSPQLDPQAFLPGLDGEGEHEGFRGELTFQMAGFVAWATGAQEDAKTRSEHAAFLAPDGGNLLEEPPEDDPEAVRLVNPLRRTEWGGGAGWGDPTGRVAGHVAVRRTDHGEAAEEARAWRAVVSGRPVPQLTLRASVGSAERPGDVVGRATLAALAATGSGEIHPGRLADPGALERWSDWRVEAAWTRPGWRLSAAAFGADGEGAFLWARPSTWLYFDRGQTELFLLGDIPFNAFDVVDLRISGFEAEAVVPLPWGLRGHASWRRLDVVENELTDASVPYVPQNQAMGQLRWADRLFPSRDLLAEARLTGRYVGVRSTLGEEALPDYLTADLLVQTTIINFTIFVSYKNLFGIGHRSEESFFLPGREGFLGVLWRFRL